VERANTGALLVTDRGPGRAARAIQNGAGLMVAPIGRGGVFSARLGDAWRSVGALVVEVPTDVDAVDSRMVRDVFDLTTPDEGYEWIRFQREAIVAEEWRSILAWVPRVVMWREVVADVVPWRLGAVEEAVRLGAGTIGTTVDRAASLYRYSRSSFWAGEVALKAAAAPRGRADADVLFYADTPNHWRHCAPVAEELARRGLSVGFIAAAIAGVHAFVPPGIPVVTSLDSRALRPDVLSSMVHGVRQQPDARVAASGRISDAAGDSLTRRARYARMVYEKARAVGRSMSARVCVFGDASAHRPAGLAAGLREIGVPSIAVQHGAIGDARRYAQSTDVFLVWDAESARAVAAEPAMARTLVVGSPALEAETRELGGRQEPIGGRVLLTPSNRSERVLREWIASAIDVCASAGAKDVVLRMHPLSPPDVARAMASEFPVCVSETASLAEDVLAADVVVHDGSSVGAEARLLGVPEVRMSTAVSGASVRYCLGRAVSRDPVSPAVAGAIGRAADAIVAVFDE
jgi:hypothetical protein